MKYWYETRAIARRILTELFRQQRTLILWVIFPISMLLLNGFILAEGSKITTLEAFRLATPSTLVGAALFFSSLGGTISTIVAERESKTIKRLFLSPLAGISYFLGIFCAYGCIGIGQSLLIYTVAALFGVEFSGSWFLGAIVIFCSIASYVGMGFLLGTQFARRAEDVNSLVAGFGVPLLMLGGAFVPTTFLPKQLLLVTQFNPIYHMNEALLAISYRAKDLDDYDLRLHFLFLGGFLLISLASGWLAYRRMLSTERRL
ncbi:ABC-type multidrug transport system, permease component [Synechococcus sp. PCC 7502]|uniref:ABC transporter permease n=1 Tax=Synechococcus sp. PCC 7502 TaxID=1173263 RepID=UPI00029F90C6|nr:ABC transporter permease [Synechococcus sp. PCC 7502]AFY72461.1 ABC-type multidrug transport system, permease component [Synechococcus sp. PCC 7502]